MKAQRGTSLMEMLVYLVVFMTVMSSVLSAYYLCLQVRKVGTYNIQSIAELELLTKSLARDVRGASGFPRPPRRPAR